MHTNTLEQPAYVTFSYNLFISLVALLSISSILWYFSLDSRTEIAAPL